jgi:hypothetical protein
VIILTVLSFARPVWAEAEESIADDTQAEPSGDIALGARLGVQLGVGGATPGGLRVGGAYLQRLTEDWWFDGEASFSFGGGGMQCDLAPAPGDAPGCDHGLADGTGVQAIVGARWALPRSMDGFQPYLRGGVGLGVASFGDDEVNGLALLGQIAGGGKFHVAERIAVGAEAALFLGPAFFSDDLGTLGYGGLVVQGAIEFEL